MRVDLPGGHWAELRDIDQVKGGDRRAYKAAVKFRFGADGEPQEVGGDMQDRQRMAVLRRLITAWSLTEYPLPLSQPPDHPEPVLDELPLPILEALDEAVDPYIELLEKSGKSSKTSTASSSDGSPADVPATST